MRPENLSPFIGKSVSLKTRVGKTYNGTITKIDADILTLKNNEGKLSVMTCGLISLVEEV